MKRCIVLFSGGIDSAYTVAKSAGEYDSMVLVTYVTPGMTRVKASLKVSSQLRRLYGNKISHRIIDIRAEVDSLRGGAARCVADNVKYRFFYSWCLGCKVAMHLHTVKLCRELGIKEVLDGSNIYDALAMEQYEEVKGIFREIYLENGISYISPFYREDGGPAERGRVYGLLRRLGLVKDSTQKRVAYLRKEGIDVGWGFVDQYRSCQPSCVASLLFNIPRIFLRFLFDEKKSGYLDYVRDRSRGR